MPEKYKNRYGVEYWFDPIDDNQYRFCMDEYGSFRVGGKEGQDTLDEQNLGFFDPAGGPFMAPGYEIYDTKHGYRKVWKLGFIDDELILEVE